MCISKLFASHSILAGIAIILVALMIDSPVYADGCRITAVYSEVPGVTYPWGDDPCAVPDAECFYLENPNCPNCFRWLCFVSESYRIKHYLCDYVTSPPIVIPCDTSAFVYESIQPLSIHKAAAICPPFMTCMNCQNVDDYFNNLINSFMNGNPASTRKVELYCNCTLEDCY